MLLGADNVFKADTGAISGTTAGGFVKKAADIVPENGDLSVATLLVESINHANNVYRRLRKIFYV